MPRAKVRTVVDLTVELSHRLEARSAETGAPKVELIRRALDQYLPKATQPVVITNQEVGNG